MKKAQSEQERTLGSKNSDRKKLKKNQELEDEVKEICLEIYTHTHRDKRWARGEAGKET